MGRYLGALAAGLAGLAGVIGGVAPSAGASGEWAPDEVHDYVGLAVFYDHNGVPMHQCSGALISDTMFLTAGRCTDGASSARIWFDPVIGADADRPTGFDAATGYPQQCLDGGRCVSSEVLLDYGYTGLAAFPDTRDVGLVLLREPPPGVQGRGRLPEPDSLDPLAVGPERNRTVFTVSGYGVATPDPLAGAGEARTRLLASAPVIALRSSLNDGFNLQTNGNGAGFSGACVGEPGGPVLLGGDGDGPIVAVGSFGLDAWCRGTDLSYRIDRAEVLDWIRGGYLSTSPEPGA
jgi:hypothetical protein